VVAALKNELKRLLLTSKMPQNEKKKLGTFFPSVFMGGGVER
jgi:hypothetical protein